MQVKPPIPEVDPDTEEFCIFMRATSGVSSSAAIGSHCELQQQQYIVLHPWPVSKGSVSKSSVSRMGSVAPQTR